MIASAPAVPASRTFEVDLRNAPHSRRRRLVLARLESLRPQDRLVVVCDYEPKVLRLQLEAWFPDVFVWRWERPGPVVWRAEITRRR